MTILRKRLNRLNPNIQESYFYLLAVKARALEAKYKAKARTFQSLGQGQQGYDVLFSKILEAKA